MARDYVLTVMSLDRVGIVAGVTEAILELGGNIDAISQTVLRGYFTIIITLRFDEEVSEDELKKAVRARGAAGELEVSVKERTVKEPEPVVPEGDRFVLTITGPDQKGIVKRITAYLAGRNTNIDDLYAYGEGDRFVLIGQLLVPEGEDVENLKMDIEGMIGGRDVSINLQHENVFIATNQIDFSQRCL